LTYYEFQSTSASGLLVPDGIICLLVSILALIWFIRYIYYWNLQFPNNGINIKTKVLLPQVKINLRRLWLSCLGTLAFLLLIETHNQSNIVLLFVIGMICTARVSSHVINKVIFFTEKTKNHTVYCILQEWAISFYRYDEIEENSNKIWK
jgi:hypothetical protein